MKKTKRRNIGLPALFLALAVISFSASALKAEEEEQKAGRGVSVSPSKFDIILEKGEAVKKTLNLFNPTDVRQTYIFTKQDAYIRKNALGEMGIDYRNPKEEGEESPWGISNWLSFQEGTFIVEPLSTKQIEFTLTIPEEAGAGGHYGAVNIANPVRPEEIPPLPQEGTPLQGKGVTVPVAHAVEVTATIFVTVPGDMKWSGELTSFFGPSFVEKGPVNFYTAFKNTGTVHQKPKGTIEIYNFFNKRIDTLDLQFANVLPKITKRQESRWLKSFLVGPYKAVLTLKYGRDYENTVTASATFLAFPYKMALAVTTVVILLTLVERQRRNRPRPGRPRKKK